MSIPPLPSVTQNHHPERVAGVRVRTRVTTTTHTRPISGEMNREYAPSGARNPSLVQVKPPSNASTTAATPAVKSRFEISPERQSPNDPDMINIARGNDVITTPAQRKSFSADVSAEFPAPAIEYVSAATTVMSRRYNPPNAALEAVAPAPHPSAPLSARTFLSAAANHMRLTTFHAASAAAMRIRMRSAL